MCRNLDYLKSQTYSPIWINLIFCIPNATRLQAFFQARLKHFLHYSQDIFPFSISQLLLQIYDGKKKPEVLVDDWNVYFFDDLKTLVSVWDINILCLSASVNIFVNMHITACPKYRPILSFATCSPVAGHRVGGTLRRWGSCGSACSAFTPRTSTSESKWSVTVCTAASPPSTSSGRPNTSSLKVSSGSRLVQLNYSAESWVLFHWVDAREFLSWLKHHQV